MNLRTTNRAQSLFTIALLTMAVAVSGCVKSYRNATPLRFSDFPYTSADGKAWPEKRAVLPGLAKTYGLPHAPEITYVELNPSGTRTVVFIHGLGSYLKFWRYQLDVFATEGFRVIALDLPGYGKSEKPATFPYTSEAFTAAARELVAQLGISKPIVAGHSMGGQIALFWGIQFPDEPAALLLTAPAGFEEFSKREKLWFRRVMSTEVISQTTEYGIWGSVRQANFSHWRPELEWLIEERVRVAKTPEFQSYAYACVRSIHGLAENDFVRTSLGRITAPTAIIYGAEDRLIPNPYLHGGWVKTIMTDAHHKIRGSKLVPLSGCGHGVQLDCPDDYNREALAFIRALP